jgi:hypothetical protein
MCVCTAVIGATPPSQGLHFFLTKPSDISLMCHLDQNQMHSPQRTQRKHRKNEATRFRGWTRAEATPSDPTIFSASFRWFSFAYLCVLCGEKSGLQVSSGSSLGQLLQPGDANRGGRM